MTDLLLTTIEALREGGKEPKDVAWVGSRDGRYAITWDDFAAIAPREYDGGYGAQEIADDLVVVGDGWWLERHEYDGSEWWEFKSLPVRQLEAKSFASVRSGNIWASLEQMNRPGGKHGNRSAATE